MLTLFWKWLEKRPSRTAVMAEWQSAAGECLAAIKPMLGPLDRRATVYPNPCGEPMKVVVHGDGQVVAIDESDWQHRIALEPDDIVLYRLDLRSLRTTLCNTLDDLNIAKTPVDQDATCLQVGNWEPKKAARFPVYLLLCQHVNLLRLQVAQLIASQNRSAAILLTPSRMNWDDALVSSAKTNNMLLVPLSEIIAPNERIFQKTPAWEEYLRAFCQMAELTMPSSYQSEKPIPMRGKRATDIERLERELEQHLLAARDHAYTLQQRGQEPILLPRPDQKDLAKSLGITKSAVSRCLKDPRAKVLKILWQTTDSLDDVMRYRKR